MPVRPGTAQIYTVPCSMSAQFPAFQATGLGFCFMKLGIIGSTSTALSVTILAGAELVRERSVTIIIFMGRAGSLDRYDLNPQSFRFHSPYQVEAEFLSDLAEMTRAWVPNLISQTARDHGNILLEKYFINRVGYRIGQPRPW